MNETKIRKFTKEWLSSGVNAFINMYLNDHFDNPVISCDVQQVETLNILNSIYSWTIKNKSGGLVVISFNDLDFKFNAMVSFNIPNPEDPTNYYYKEINNTSLTECSRFIISELNENYIKNLYEAVRDIHDEQDKIKEGFGVDDDSYIVPLPTILMGTRVRLIDRDVELLGETYAIIEYNSRQYYTLQDNIKAVTEL